MLQVKKALRKSLNKYTSSNRKTIYLKNGFVILKRKAFLSTDRASATEELQASSEPAKLTFETKLLNYAHIFHIKQIRFGKELENFKNVWEKPLVTKYAEEREIADKEVKKLEENELIEIRKKIDAKKEKKKDTQTLFNEWESFITNSNNQLLRKPEISPYMLGKRDTPGEEDFVFLKESASMIIAKSNLLGDKTEPISKNTPTKELIIEMSKLPDYEQLISVRKELSKFNFPLKDIVAEYKNKKPPEPVKRGRSKRLNPEVPATYLHAEEIKVKKEAKTVIDVEPTKETPVLFIDSDYPTIIDRHKGNIMRKSKMMVYIPAMNLPPSVLERLIELTGSRYNKQTEVLTLVSDVKDTVDENKLLVIRKFKEILNEAWKSDLNYIPVDLPMLPHQKIEKELREKEEAEKLKSAESLEHYKVPGRFTFFVYPFSMLPSQNWEELRKKSIEKLVKQLAS
eukprot:TRINITY_DN1267_c0_g1_i1.p1 TRINITY_DN1267_c0_g1~~TRINITY_DN1267_c0_g1_i1.p1  ORF type:complete len:456 (+),score=85.04 TRINITY_DN1267_c0_g1_i1:81-1448(+)